MRSLDSIRISYKRRQFLRLVERRLCSRAAAIALTICSFAACEGDETYEAPEPPFSEASKPSDLIGDLYIIADQTHGNADEEGPLIQSTFVNGPNYAGMEDNDIRGFLDGEVRWGWNQVSQIHTRVGRRGSAPDGSEPELFRNLYTWKDIRLPSMQTIERVEIVLSVEFEIEKEITLYFYPLFGSYLPGAGGVEKNNNSAPARGEVWWQERAHKVDGWGLPGASLARGTWRQPVAGADTSAMPIAAAKYAPGLDRLEFTSPELTSYVEHQLIAGEPVSLLLKISDYGENSLGHRLTIYSGDEGDGMETSRRPTMNVVWRPRAGAVLWHQPVWLEYGRRFSAALPKNTLSGEVFLVASTSGPISMQLGDETNAEKLITSGEINSMQARFDRLTVSALERPIALGHSFQASLRDTWIPAGEPSEQSVKWYFKSPSGGIHEAEGVFEGDYEWSVSFAPNEIGKWQYVYWHRFTRKDYWGSLGTFHVLADSVPALRQALENFISEIDKKHASKTTLLQSFFQLQKAFADLRSNSILEPHELDHIKQQLTSLRVRLSEIDS